MSDTVQKKSFVTHRGRWCSTYKSRRKAVVRMYAWPTTENIAKRRAVSSPQCFELHAICQMPVWPKLSSAVCTRPGDHLKSVKTLEETNM